MSRSDIEQMQKLVHEDYQTGMTYKEICKKHGITEYKLKKWQKDGKWKRKKVVAEKTRGKPGAPKGNKNRLKHGLFSKYYPTDAQKILEEMNNVSGLDFLWSSIEAQYIAILRSHQLMYVKDQDDMTKEVKKDKLEETEYEIQFAWDKHEKYMRALSVATTALTRMIKEYEEQLHKNWELTTDEQRTRIEVLKGKLVNQDANKEDKLDRLFETIEREMQQ